MVQESGNTFILCPKCGGPTRVFDSRGSGEQCIRRRRKCMNCQGRFKTYEVIVDDRRVPTTAMLTGIIAELDDKLAPIVSLVQRAKSALVLIGGLEKKENSR